jgi:hypothetical protein
VQQAQEGEAMPHWQIRYIDRLQDGKPVAGRLVAEIKCADGSGELTVYDPEYGELLHEVFEQDQFIMTEADCSDDICSDGGSILPAWHPEAIQLARRQIFSDRLMVIEIS